MYGKRIKPVTGPHRSAAAEDIKTKANNTQKHSLNPNPISLNLIFSLSGF